MSSVAMGRLVEAVTSLAAAPVGELPDAQVVDELLALRKLADVAEAGYLSRLAVFDARNLGEVDGLSTRAWLRHRAHVAPGETSRSVKTAKTVQGLPVVAAALAAGEIRVPHAAAITDGASLLGTDVIAGCQDALVDAARTDEPSRLRAGLRGLGAATENRRAVREAERRDEGRWLDVTTTFEGAVHLHGVLGAEDGAVVKAAIDTLTAPGAHHGLSDVRTGTGADDPGPPGASAAAAGRAGSSPSGRAGGSVSGRVGGDRRTAGQRRADALVEVCRRQLDTGGLPTTGGEVPHLVVTTDLATLEARTGGLGELPDGAILRGEAVRRLACDARITRVITGPASQPLDVGRSQRTATTAQRRALRVRDGDQCRFPGCDRPATWCQTHHVIFWTHGGHTNTDEMILLCSQHHTAVHEHDWHVHLTAPGRFTFTDPAGNTIPSPPAQPTRHLVNQLTNATTTNQANRPPPPDTPPPRNPSDTEP